MTSDTPLHGASDDRRESPRRATKIDAHVEHPGGVIHGLVVDISFGGAKFVTETITPALEIGCQVVLTVAASKLMGSAELNWRGAVVRSERSGDDGPDRIAYAIAFEDSTSSPIPRLDGLDGLDDSN